MSRATCSCRTPPNSSPSTRPRRSDSRGALPGWSARSRHASLRRRCYALPLSVGVNQSETTRHLLCECPYYPQQKQPPSKPFPLLFDFPLTSAIPWTPSGSNLFPCSVLQSLYHPFACPVAGLSSCHAPSSGNPRTASRRSHATGGARIVSHRHHKTSDPTTFVPNWQCGSHPDP